MKVVFHFDESIADPLNVSEKYSGPVFVEFALTRRGEVVRQLIIMMIKSVAIMGGNLTQVILKLAFSTM